MEELTRHFANDRTGVEKGLSRVTAAAVELINGVDYADVLLIDGDEFRSITPTSPVTVGLDTAQCELQEGPCLQAALGDAVIRSPNLVDDRRWPRFAGAAADAGANRAMCYPLYTYDGGAGALNLFGRAAVPSTSRDIIGQAKGIIMERFHVDAGRTTNDHPPRDQITRDTRC